MANLFESPAWESGIYQLETTDRALAGPDGILNVPFKQLANRTLALRRRLQQLRFNVLDFGALPQPGFDNTAAFSDACIAAAAEGGGTVYAPPGRYELLGAFSLPNGVLLEGAGSGRTQLVLQDAGSAEAHIRASGTFAPISVTLSEPAVPGHRHLRVVGAVPPAGEHSWLLAGAEAGSFSGADALPGEFVQAARLTGSFQLGSTLVTGLSHGVILRAGDALVAPGLLPAGTVVVSAGQDQLVLSEAALQTSAQAEFSVPGLVALTRPLRAMYLPGAAALYETFPVQVGLEALSLLALNDKPALAVLLGQGCHLEDVVLEGPLAARVRLGLCRELRLHDLRARDTEPAPNSSSLLTLQGCEMVLLDKLQVETARTAISLLPWEGGAALLNRNIQLSGSHLISKGGLPLLESGANTDGLLLQDVTFTGTVKLGGADLVVRACRFMQKQPDVSLLAFDALRGGRLLLEDNLFEGHAIQGGVGQTLVLFPAPALSTLGAALAIQVLRNTWRFAGFLGTGLFVHAAGGNRAVDFVLKDNLLEAETNSLEGRQRLGLRLLGQAEGGFERVLAEGNRFLGLGMVLERLQASLVELLRNEFVEAPNDALSLQPSAAYHLAQAHQRVYLRHNRVLRSGRTGISLTGDADGTRTLIKVEDNEVLEANQRANASGVASSSLSVAVASEVNLVRNTFGSQQALPLQGYGFAVQSVARLYETENLLRGDLTNFTMGVAERVSRVTHNGELKEAYRTTAPSTGSWKAGDRVWNSNPTNRNNLGWVCIGSGTPGTWVPIGSSQSSVQVKLHGPFVMSAGQTILMLPEAYQTNRRLLQVFRSGLALSQSNDPTGTDFDWVVESSISIRFRKPCLQDEVVEVIEFQIGEDDSATSASPQAVQIQEITTGDINSTDGFDGNGTFYVSHPILTDPLPVVKISGIAELRYGIDYTVDGTSITVLPGAKPIAQEWLVVTYYYLA